MWGASVAAARALRGFGGRRVAFHRLRRAQDFALCYARGRVGKSRHVVVHARQNGLGCSRVGFSVGKRLGKATQRNRVKRRLREIVRLMAPSLCSGVDVVVVARVAAGDADYDDLRRGVVEGLTRAGILGSNGPGAAEDSMRRGVRR